MFGKAAITSHIILKNTKNDVYPPLKKLRICVILLFVGSAKKTGLPWGCTGFDGGNRRQKSMQKGRALLKNADLKLEAENNNLALAA